MPVPYKMTTTVSKSWRRNGKNAAKFEVIRIITKRNPFIFPYQIHWTTVNVTNQAKYLGVTITPDRSWKCHNENITKNGNSILAFLLRNIRWSQPEAKAKACNTYVRPSVEYASSVWSPAAESHINQRDMDQRRAARFVRNDYAQQSSVKEMVISLHWITLQKRRGMARVTMLYKIKHNLVDVTPDPLIRSARTSRGNPQKHVRNLCTRTTP